MAKKQNLILLAAGSVILACGGKTLDVGSNRDPTNLAGNGGNGGNGGSGAGGSGGSGGSANTQTNMDPLPDWPDVGACGPNSDLPIAGVWEGRVADIHPRMPELTTIRVTIRGNAQTGLCGSVVYGEGTEPPPATDPDARYPSAESGYPDPLFGYGPERDGFAGSPGEWGPMLGKAYSILDAQLEAPRVRFRTVLGEVWKGWCALQTPIPGDAPVHYGCTYSAYRSGPEGCYFVDPATEAEQEFNCFKVSACGTDMICSCNAAECRANHTGIMEFDLEFEADSARGTLDAVPSNAITLTRVQ